MRKQTVTTTLKLRLANIIRICTIPKRSRLCLLLAFGLLLSAFFLSCDAQRAMQSADGVWQNVTIALDVPVDAKALRAQEFRITYTVWGAQNGVTVTDPDLGRRTQAEVLSVHGAPSLLLPMSEALASDDKDGCLIGEQTAWELFGSTQVIGDQVLVGDELRTIRAVLHQPKEILVLCGLDDSNYNRITLASRQAEDGEDFLMQSGLTGELLRLDYLRSLRWLTELIPGRWSDFSGWSTNLEQKKQDFTNLARVQKNSIELCYEAQCRLILWDTVLEVICVTAAAFLIQRSVASHQPGQLLHALNRKRRRC